MGWTSSERIFVGLWEPKSPLQLSSNLHDHRHGVSLWQLWVSENWNLSCTTNEYFLSNSRLSRIPLWAKEELEDNSRNDSWTGILLHCLWSHRSFWLAQLRSGANCQFVFVAFLDWASRCHYLRLSVRGWIHVLSLPNAERTLQSFLHAHPYFLWTVWLCVGDRRKFNGNFWKGILRNAWERIQWVPKSSTSRQLGRTFDYRLRNTCCLHGNWTKLQTWAVARGHNALNWKFWIKSSKETCGQWLHKWLEEVETISLHFVLTT